MKLEKPEMIPLDPSEQSRTYWFPINSGTQDEPVYDLLGILIDQVTHIAVSVSGNHRLKTSNGKLHVVPFGWLHLEINASDWTF